MLLIFTCIILVMLTLVIGMAMFATALTMRNSDAAGNAMAAGFAALEAIAVHVLLGVLLIIAAASGRMPLLWGLAALLLLPGSGWAVVAAIEAMRHDGMRWLAIVVGGLPVLILLYCAWCFIPALHAAIAPTTAVAAAWGPVLVIALLPLVAWIRHQLALAAIIPPTPEQLAAEEAIEKEQQRQQRAESFDSLTVDSPFWQWWDYAQPDSEFRQEAMEGCRKATNRQVDVPRMVGQGNRALFLLVPQLDLSATPEMEQGIREFLIDQVKNLMPYDPARSITTKIVTDWFEPYFPTLRWLIDNGRSCNAELAAIAEAVRKYPDCAEREKFLADLHQLCAKEENGEGTTDGDG